MSTQTDEQYVREVMDSAMSGTRVPLDLPAMALARGRRLRARRRAWTAAAGVAACTALAVTVSWVAVGGDGPVGDTGLVATEPPAPAPRPPRVPPGWWDQPATDMVAAVAAILPDDVVVTDPGPLDADTPEGGPAHGWIAPRLRGPAGGGALNVILSPGPAPGLDLVGTDVDVTCGGEHSSDLVRCVELHDERGTVVGRRMTSRWRGGVTVNEVVLRRDGGTVQASSSNTLDDKWSEDSPVSATRPPLTLDQLEDLVRNDTWVSHQP